MRSFDWGKGGVLACYDYGGEMGVWCGEWLGERLPLVDGCFVGVREGEGGGGGRSMRVACALVDGQLRIMRGGW